jgi:hypothetical protein
MDLKVMVVLILACTLVACAQERKIVPAASPMPRTLPPQNVLLTPQNPTVPYEVVGQVEISGKEAASLDALYQNLGDECRKMGGDMVINVTTGAERQSPSVILNTPGGYGRSVLPPLTKGPGAWGKGTIVKIKNEAEREAYQKEVGEGDVGGACTIIGLPLEK